MFFNCTPLLVSLLIFSMIHPAYGQGVFDCKQYSESSAIPENALTIARNSISGKELDIFEKVIWVVDRRSNAYYAEAYIENGSPIVRVSRNLIVFLCSYVRDRTSLGYNLGVLGGKEESEFDTITGWDLCTQDPRNLAECPMIQNFSYESLFKTKPHLRRRLKIDHIYHRLMFDFAMAFILLHEFGHIHLGHVQAHGTRIAESTSHEYDADTFAIERLFGSLERRTSTSGAQYALAIWMDWEEKRAYGSAGINNAPPPTHEASRCRAVRAEAVEWAFFVPRALIMDWNEASQFDIARSAIIQRWTAMAGTLDKAVLSYVDKLKQCGDKSAQFLGIISQDFVLLNKYMKKVDDLGVAGDLLGIVKEIMNPIWKMRTDSVARIKSEIDSNLLRLTIHPSIKDDQIDLFQTSVISFFNDTAIISTKSAGRLFGAMGLSEIYNNKNYALESRLQKAKQYFRDSVRYNPALTESYLNLAFIAIIERNYNSAESYLLNSISNATDIGQRSVIERYYRNFNADKDGVRMQLYETLTKAR